MSRWPTVLDMYVGQSERNVKELFEVARSSAPCVLFLDELDAIGQKRSLIAEHRSPHHRQPAPHRARRRRLGQRGRLRPRRDEPPWDVDPALRRPGRLDRTLLVLPPTVRRGRRSCARTCVTDRSSGSTPGVLAKATDGYSGADLAHLCESASENALMESVESGTVRMIGMADFDQALAEIRPSIKPWMETARNVALYAQCVGEYDDLRNGCASSASRPRTTRTAGPRPRRGGTRRHDQLLVVRRAQRREHRERAVAVAGQDGVARHVGAAGRVRTPCALRDVPGQLLGVRREHDPGTGGRHDHGGAGRRRDVVHADRADAGHRQRHDDPGERGTAPTATSEPRPMPKARSTPAHAATSVSRRAKVQSPPGRRGRSPPPGRG
jgi:hypothetical protein